MKTILYAALLFFEALWGIFATLLMIFSWELYWAAIITLAVFAALMIFLVKRLKKQKKEGNTDGASRTRLFIALTMLIPILPAFIVVFFIALTLAIHG